MGWNIDINCDRDVQVQDVDAIVKALPDELVGAHTKAFPELKVRQDWGWSCAVDVHNPEGRKLGLHGAWFSAEKAEQFSKHMCSELRKLGYKCQHTKPRG